MDGPIWHSLSLGVRLCWEVACGGEAGSSRVAWVLWYLNAVRSGVAEMMVGLDCAASRMMGGRRVWRSDLLVAKCRSWGCSRTASKERLRSALKKSSEVSSSWNAIWLSGTDTSTSKPRGLCRHLNTGRSYIANRGCIDSFLDIISYSPVHERHVTGFVHSPHCLECHWHSCAMHPGIMAFRS